MILSEAQAQVCHKTFSQKAKTLRKHMEAMQYTVLKIGKVVFFLVMK